MILLPFDFVLPDICLFFENVSYFHSYHIQDLFLDTTTFTKSFTPYVPTYTPSLPISTQSPHVSLTKYFLSSVDVTTTDTLLLLTAPTSWVIY